MFPLIEAAIAPCGQAIQVMGKMESDDLIQAKIFSVRDVPPIGGLKPFAKPPAVASRAFPEWDSSGSSPERN
jgi:hypothetical protein